MSRPHANIALFVPHIGCPRQCSFCDQRAITGGAQAPAPADVEKAAATAARTLGERARDAEVAFFGGSFTAIDQSYMEALLQAAQEAVARYHFKGIRLSTRPDAVGEGMLALLSQYGVTAIELGAQSMDDGVLALNRRGHTAAQTADAARRIKARGFELGVQMMTGLYGDTDEKALLTGERLIALGPQTVRIYPTVVLPGTELAALYQAGEYIPQTLEQAVELCARLLPLFEGAGVRVIRVGLHAQQEVEGKALAGAYHPALRQLVESRLFLRQLQGELLGRPPGAYEVAVNPRSLSTAQGQRKTNLQALGQIGYRVALSQDGTVPLGAFVIKSPASQAFGP